MPKQPVSNNIVELRKQPTPFANWIMHKYGVVYKTQTADVKLNRHQIAVIHLAKKEGNPPSSGSKRRVTLLDLVEAIVVPASQGDEKYKERLHKMFKRKVEDDAIAELLVKMTTSGIVMTKGSTNTEFKAKKDDPAREARMAEMAKLREQARKARGE